MSVFKQNVPLVERYDVHVPMYMWREDLQNSENGRAVCVPAAAFSRNIPVDISDILKVGLHLEAVPPGIDEEVDGTLPRWFCRVEKVEGYRVLVKFLQSDAKVWLNILSKDVHPLSTCIRKSKLTKAYKAPASIGDGYYSNRKKFTAEVFKSMKNSLRLQPSFLKTRLDVLYTSNFQAKKRVEVINYLDSTEIHVGLIEERCGRRLRILIVGEGQEQLLRTHPTHKQADPNQEFWVDESSFFLLPVGFAMLNGLDLKADEAYFRHTMEIKKALKEGQDPPYHHTDMTFDDFEIITGENQLARREQVRAGQKFEFFDPLNNEFKTLKCGTITAICQTDGYVMLKDDGSAKDMGFPVNIRRSTFIYPIKYSTAHNVPLETNDFLNEVFNGEEFDWDIYLEKTQSRPLPVHNFRTEPPFLDIQRFKVGALLEAADQNQGEVWPASIVSVHGRILKIHFKGFDHVDDEFYDVSSHDIMPVGWCEMHDFPLEIPPVADNRMEYEVAD